MPLHCHSSPRKRAHEAVALPDHFLRRKASQPAPSASTYSPLDRKPHHYRHQLLAVVSSVCRKEFANN